MSLFRRGPGDAEIEAGHVIVRARLVGPGEAVELPVGPSRFALVVVPLLLDRIEVLESALVTLSHRNSELEGRVEKLEARFMDEEG